MRTLILSSLLAGCVINGNKTPRPRDLEQPWAVSKARLLGVRSEPAEPRPGDTVTFEALLVDPTNTIESTLWLACPSSADDGTGFGCTEGNEEFIGIEPFQPPVLQTPSDLLDGLDEQERREGAYYIVQVTGLPEIDPNDPDIDFEDIDFNEIEAGYKRVVVSEATTPNNNPRIAGLTADGNVLFPGTVVEVDPDQDYDIGVVIDDTTIERYEFLNSDGVVEDRVEEPYATWYATDGRVVEPFTLYPFTEATWRSPETSGTEGHLWAVVRDRRGGQDWVEIPFRVR